MGFKFAPEQTDSPSRTQAVHLLTPRQCELARMLQQGLDNAAIARR